LILFIDFKSVINSGTVYTFIQIHIIANY